MKLDIKHWQLILAVDQYGTLGQAANVLGATQPALSHRLAEAERRLGNEIFKREGRTLRLTPGGQLLRDAALRHLAELERAEKSFVHTAREKAHLIRLGIAHYSSYHWVSGFIRSLPVKREKLQLDFVTAAIQKPIDSLRQRSADILLYPGHYKDDLIESWPLLNDELVLVTHPQHRLSKRSYIEAEDLRNELYLTYSVNAEPGFEYERFFSPAGIVPESVQLVEMTDAIVELVIAEQGVSILSRWALRRPIAQKLVTAMPLTEHGLSLNWSILTRKSDRKQLGVKMARDLLQAHFVNRNGG